MKHISIIRFTAALILLSNSIVTTCRSVPKQPKNIILMISDGWSYNHILATDYYQYGKTNLQSYQAFPLHSAVSTYMAGGCYEPDRAWASFDYVKKNPTESAAAATALSTGTMTYKGAICVDTEKNPLENIVQRAEKLSKATGVVTSVFWNHATPAGMVAHDTSRNNYIEIAREMIYDSGLEVIMGCGHPFYDDNAKPVTPDENDYKLGETLWNDLVAGTAGNDADHDGIIDYWTMIHDSIDFVKLIDGDTPKRVLGIPQVRTTLQCMRRGQTAGQGPSAPNTTDPPYTDAFNKGVPTLEQMTMGALNVLDNEEDGFFLMVEGGAVDWASHDNTTARMIEEQIDFNESVDAVIRWINQNSSWDETLVIVTGDHECGYLTGPNSDPTWEPIKNNGKGHLPGTQWNSGSHTNQLIPLYAKGPGIQLLRRYADEYDIKRGYYLQNSEVGVAMLTLWPDP